MNICCFFFQAEDGIRDDLVTGVQTCALPILIKDKIKKFLTAGNDITIPILLLVKDTSGTFPPLQLATTGVLFIATNVKVSSVYPKRQLTFLLTVHIRASRRTRKTGMSSATMLQRWLEKLHCNGRCLVILAQKHH